MRASVLLILIGIFHGAATLAWGAGGSLTLTVEDETKQQPTITRLELWRGPPTGKTIGVPRTVPAGLGVVLDRSAVLTLADHAYSFRMIRGPEYRIVSGTFTLEKTSLDDHHVRLPRMVDMLEKGWTSGDCCVVASANSLPLRMASEDLHLATVLGHVDAKPIPHRDGTDRARADLDSRRRGPPRWPGFLRRRRERRSGRRTRLVAHPADRRQRPR